MLIISSSKEKDCHWWPQWQIIVETAALFCRPLIALSYNGRLDKYPPTAEVKYLIALYTFTNRKSEDEAASGDDRQERQ